MATPKAYGFIGLGIMGYGMAKNMRAKVPAESPIYVCELNTPRRDEWIAENASIGNVHVASTPAEVAAKCVCARHTW